ncbi:HAD family hydrolase [Kribbella capetownensis]|uniref:HAD family hydrolase n=1 Tax=Kribbella capetownensis TaxID=1572659 RepID=A0A4V2M6U6_9ACTN|nr:HAD-IA family hydrolase [Kribbella capetownensis]TCC45092.1 HAD family hydrolase [Kribbella capetownensis]
MAARVVVLDAMGVLYRHGNVVSGVLIPYLRDQGCTVGEPEIRQVYRACTLGELSTEEFWAALGVGQSASDAEYCGRHQLTDGTVDTLRSLREAGVTVLVLTNDAGPWSAHLRRRFGLEPYVDHWFVSSEIGARKPSAAAYEAVLAHPGISGSTALVDDRPTNLAAAHAAGFRPVLFHSEDTAANTVAGLGVASARSMPELLDVLTHTSAV